MRRFAFSLWLAAVLWLCAVIVTPVLAKGTARGAGLYVAAATYLGGSYICHQRPDRSFHVDGVRLPICARCFGLYAAAPVGGAIALLPMLAAPRDRGSSRRRIRLLAIAAIPTALTIAADWSGLGSSSVMRAIAALPLGGVLGWIVIDETGSGTIFRLGPMSEK